MSKFAKYIGLALLGLTVLLLLSANSALAAIVEAFAPGYGVWAHIVLAGVELAALGFFAASLFLRDKALRIRQNPTEEERRAFTKELLRRFRKNSLLQHLDPDDPHYMAASLAVLNEHADAEIRRTGQRIFLATALSQNGRLDSIIVFAVLCRLVWRISRIYNQRPHPGEILSLYTAVATSTFLAFSIEELDISTEVAASFGEMLHAVAPAVATSAVPFVGSALQKFTASVVDGAANCFLALRTGIIARNAFAFGIEGEEQPGRAAVFKEAGGMLFSMSNSILKSIVQALKGRLSTLGRFARKQAAGAAQTVLPGMRPAGAAMGADMGDVGTDIGVGAGEIPVDSSYAEVLYEEIPSERNAQEPSANLLRRAGGAVGATALRTGQAVGVTALRTGQAVARPFMPRGKNAAPNELPDELPEDLPENLFENLPDDTKDSQ